MFKWLVSGPAKSFFFAKEAADRTGEHLRAVQKRASDEVESARRITGQHKKVKAKKPWWRFW